MSSNSSQTKRKRQQRAYKMGRRRKRRNASGTTPYFPLERGTERPEELKVPETPASTES